MNFKVFKRIILELQCDLRSSFEGITSRVGENLKGTVFRRRTEDILGRFRVFLRFGWYRCYVNLVGDEEATIETETECSDEISSSCPVCPFSPSKEFGSARFRKGTLIEDVGFGEWKALNRRTRLFESSSGPIPIPVSMRASKIKNARIDQTQITRYYELSTLAIFIPDSLDSDIERVCTVPDGFVD